jgi:hypothetical protein
MSVHVDVFVPDHAHQCRDCGSSIDCDEVPCTWPGGNAGCPIYCDESEA